MKNIIHSKSILTHFTTICFLFLLIVTIINFVKFIEENNILYLLSFCATFIATLFYGIFFLQKKTNNSLRYIDWILTTPILLLELCILSKIKNPYVITSILLLNFSVFVFGWLGEIKKISRSLGCFLGFLPFIFLFYLFLSIGTYSYFIPFFIVVWTLYGITYLLHHKNIRNLSYNLLDIISKGVFSILLF